MMMMLLELTLKAASNLISTLQAKSCCDCDYPKSCCLGTMM